MAARRRNRSSWTLARVVAEIYLLDAFGEDLDPRQLSKDGYASLVAAATRFAGSWRKACHLAGAVDGRGRQRWHRSKVLAQLRRRHARGEPMNARALRRDGCGSLAKVSVYLFGTYLAACRQAGVKVIPRGNQRWTRETVIDEIRRLSALGLHMSASHLVKGGHRDVVKGAQRYLGGWPAAMRLARVPASREPWTRERVLEQIRRRHGKGASLSCGVLRQEKRGSALLWAAQKFYGGWPRAVKAAGLTPANAPMWTAESVRTALRRLARKRQWMSSEALVKNGHGNIVSGALRVHGTWAAALRAAGIPRPKRRAV